MKTFPCTRHSNVSNRFTAFRSGPRGITFSLLAVMMLIVASQCFSMDLKGKDRARGADAASSTSVEGEKSGEAKQKEEAEETKTRSGRRARDLRASRESAESGDEDESVSSRGTKDVDVAVTDEADPAESTEQADEEEDSSRVSVLRALEAAQSRFSRGDYAGAMELLEPALESSPEYLPLWQLKARIHYRKKEYEAADEAAEVCFASHIDADTATIAFRNVMEWPELETEERVQKYADMTSALDQDMLAHVLGELVGNYGSFSPASRDLAAAWRKCGLQPAVATEIIERYANLETAEAARLLAQPETENVLGRLAGPLNYVVGKRLAFAHDDAGAQARLLRARDFGFVSGDSFELLSRIYNANGNTAAATEALVSGWRYARHPGNAAVRAVDALMGIDNADAALALADTALASFPRLPGLQARRLLLLRLMKKTADADAYEKELKEKGLIPGLRYGKILVARREGLEIDDGKELDAIAKYVNTRLGYNLEFETVESWLDHGPGLLDLDARGEAQHLMTLGRRFWDEDNRDDALALWYESLGYAQPGASRSLLTTAIYLANENMPGAALDLLDRYAPPGFTAMDLAATLAEENRWQGVKAFFDAAGTRGMANGSAWSASESTGIMGRGSWPDLLKAVANVNQGTVEEAERAVADLVRHPVEMTPLKYRRLNKRGGWEFGEMTLKQHRKLRKELQDTVILRHYSSIYPLLLDSPQWRADMAGGEDVPGTFGLALLKAGELDRAKELFSGILSRSPEDPGANLYLALVALKEGDRQLAGKYTRAGLKTAKGFTRERLLSLQARDHEDRKQEIRHLTACVRMQPDNDDLRLEAVQALAAEHRYLDARDLVRFFERKERRDPDVVSHLAMSYGEVGEHGKALRRWRWLVARYPESLPPLSGLGVTLNKLEEFGKTVEALHARAGGTGDEELCALVAEACMALGWYDEAITWVDIGLQKQPEDKRLLSLGANAAEGMECDELMEHYAGRYIAVDPESPPIHVIYGQALVNQKKWECVRIHNMGLLKKNRRNWAALERESARIAARTDKEMPKDLWRMDRILSDNFSNDPTLPIRFGISAAAAGEFKDAYCILYDMVGYGPNSSVASLYFSRIGLKENKNLVQMEKVREVLDTLTCLWGYQYTTTSAVGKRSSSQGVCPTPLLPIIGNSSPEALMEFDAYLASRDGRACLVIGEEALVRKTPDVADIDVLRHLAATGRWEFILTDNRPPRLRGRSNEERTDFWTQAKWNGSSLESSQEMCNRLLTELNRLKQKAKDAGIPVSAWLHPSWGDYGQRRTTARQQDSNAYRQAVTKAFSIAFTQTPTGYSIPNGNCWRVPTRVVGSSADADALARSLTYTHPTRRGVLELAKVKSWNSQFAKANELFCLARAYNLDPKEISYFQGRNFQYAGDVPMAIELAHEAVGFDPGTDRTSALSRDAHRLLRPLLVVEPRYWTDSNDDSYLEAVATLSFHVTNKLELRIRAGAHRWEDGDSGRKMNGQSLGVGARYYYKPMHYIQGELRGVNVGGGGKSYLEADLYWHGRYTYDRFRADGAFTVEYHREGIETFKAQEARIRANRFAVNTSTRIADRWDLDLNAYYINRTDGNNTVGMLFRPMYRIAEKPEFRVGYWFAAADSDRNPDEYYAPRKYMAHQLVATYRHNITPKWSVNALGSFGYAKTENTSWRHVLRGNFGFAYRYNECVNITGGYQYLKLPDYTLRQYGASLEVRF